MKTSVTPQPDKASTSELPAPVSRPSRKWMRPEVRIVVIYFILASAWIIGSDCWLSGTTIDTSKAGMIQTLKGLNFVITTAILLFLVLRHAYNGWRLAEQRRLVGFDHARDKFRSLSSHVQSLREKDRAEISREIHDELGQLLTGIQMQLRVIEDRLSDREDRTLNPLIDKLVETSELVDTTINSVQRISAGLRPSALDNLGLGAALLGEAEQFSERTGIRCLVDIADIPNKLPPEISTAAFRVFQESLTNVARHADADRIEATLSIQDNVLHLMITDDGKGIDPSVIEDPQSLGLIGMLERASNVGGLLTIRPTEEKGTSVTFTVPLPSSPPPQLENPLHESSHH